MPIAPNPASGPASQAKPAETFGPSASRKIFTLSLDTATVPLVVTRDALRDFELQGLETMDEYLMQLTEHLTPANAPHLRPGPLDLVAQMVLDSANTGNMRKLMLCVLWLGHHYPSVSGLVGADATYTFITDDLHTENTAVKA